MSPKDKAIELYDKFDDELPRIDENRKAIITSMVRVCINEIDKCMCSIPLANQYGYLFQFEYWQKVKEELDKL